VWQGENKVWQWLTYDTNNALTVNRALSSNISYPIIGILKHEAFMEAPSEGIMSLNLERQWIYFTCFKLFKPHCRDGLMDFCVLSSYASTHILKLSSCQNLNFLTMESTIPWWTGPHPTPYVLPPHWQPQVKTITEENSHKNKMCV